VRIFYFRSRGKPLTKHNFISRQLYLTKAKGQTNQSPYVNQRKQTQSLPYKIHLRLCFKLKVVGAKSKKATFIKPYSSLQRLKKSGAGH
jgi:hypothetical protein